MGRVNGRLILSLQKEFELVGAVDCKKSRFINEDYGVLLSLAPLGLLVRDRLVESCLEESEVMIDFSLPEGTMEHLERVEAFIKKKEEGAGGSLKKEKKFLGYVIGTTGFSDEQEKKIEKYAWRIPILKSGNFSIGVHALKGVVKQLSQQLKEWDIDIIENHHHQKIDAPSKTALMLYDACQQGRNKNKLRLVSKRTEKNQKRRENEVGLFSLRLGGTIGEHTVFLASEQEVLSLKHTAITRDAFCKGVLQSVKRFYGFSPGLYSLKDVFGF